MDRPAPHFLTRRVWIIASLAAVLRAVPARSAPADPERVSAPVLGLRAGLIALAAADWPPASTSLTALIENAFDLDGITATVLGVSATKTTPDQRDRFSRAFALRMARELARQRPDPEHDGFAVQDIRIIGPDEWLVATRVEPPAGPVVYGWRVRSLPRGPRIVDLLRDGISMVKVQRDDLSAALASRPVEDVLAELERRSAPPR